MRAHIKLEMVIMYLMLKNWRIDEAQVMRRHLVQ